MEQLVELKPIVALRRDDKKDLREYLIDFLFEAWDKKYEN